MTKEKVLNKVTKSMNYWKRVFKKLSEIQIEMEIPLFQAVIMVICLLAIAYMGSDIIVKEKAINAELVSVIEGLENDKTILMEQMQLIEQTNSTQENTIIELENDLITLETRIDNLSQPYHDMGIMTPAIMDLYSGSFEPIKITVDPTTPDQFLEGEEITFGDKISVLKRDDNWYYISINGKNGYIDAKNIYTENYYDLFRSSSEGRYNFTAYCSCTRCTPGTGITATGTRVKVGRSIAVDKSTIPLGSVVSIEGELYVAEDTGSGVNNRHIDIYHGTHSEAIQFGTGRQLGSAEWEVLVVDKSILALNKIKYPDKGRWLLHDTLSHYIELY